MNRSNVTFEATFSDLGFVQHENLKRARLRLSIPQQKQCNLPELSIRVMDHKSGQVYGDYVLFPRHSGVNTLIMTQSLRKLAAKSNAATKLKVRITLRNPNSSKNLCSNVVGGLSSEAYLVTNTDEVKTRKRRATEGLSRQNAEDIPGASEHVSNIFRRSKRSLPTCTMKNVIVYPTYNNSIFILPPSFPTGVCGLQQPVPSGNDPMIQQLARAMTRAITSLSTSSNSNCCTPSKFNNLPVLYLDSMRHMVLRHVDNVVVTGCACPNAT